MLKKIRFVRGYICTTFHETRTSQWKENNEVVKQKTNKKPMDAREN